MQNMMKAPIIVLKEGTDSSQGTPQILSNISACLNIVDAVKTTLGPRGMDKMLVSSSGMLISNDGATIIDRLEVVHPAAKTLVEIAQSQDCEIGDGTTTVVVLAGELLKQAKSFIEDGIDPKKIASAYSRACQLAVDKVRAVQTSTNSTSSTNSTNSKRQEILNCAMTSMNSKLISNYKEKFANMVYEAVTHLSEGLPLNMIGIKKVPGGTIDESSLVLGVAFKKAFSYAGFEMQPKRFQDGPLIAVLNIELELKSEKENAELRIQNIDEYQKIVDAEWKILYDKLDKIVASNVKIVLSKLPIGDVATQYFADRDIFCAGRVPEEDLKRVLAACGGIMITVLNDEKVHRDHLGSCGLFEEVQIGKERFNKFLDCPKANTASFILRGCGDEYLDEVNRSLHDSIMVTRQMLRSSDAVVVGGGAIEMCLSKYLRDVSLSSVTGKEQLLINAFAKALEVIPRQLCLNAGLDVAEIMNPLRRKHAEGLNCFGVDLANNCVADNFKNGVWEPAISKVNSISSAVEAAVTILTVDETIKCNPRN